MERFAGRYRLLRRLGHGGMGEVFLARDLASGAECAVKRLHAHQAAHAESLKREFEALTRLRHPTIVAVHDFATTAAGIPYLVMEYVAGLPADQALTRGDWASLYAVAARMTEGLEALHAAGVVHGDLKPSNVLVIPGPAGAPVHDVKLVDFGLAGLRSNEGSGSRGTPGFAAPEVVAGAAPTAASDLYGLGATLYALIAGRRPFEGEHRSSILEQQRQGPPRAHELEQSGAPQPLIEMVLALLAPEPAERPRDAREVRREIERIHRGVRRPLADHLQAATLVGRERELARLEQWIGQTPVRPPITFVTGETGIGTTALLRELATRSALEGRPVLSLSCAALPEPGATARSLVELLVTHDEGGATSPLPAVSPADDTAPWVEAAAAAADRLAARPFLVLLDDGDHLDSVSAAFLRRLALREPAVPLIWIIARSRAAEAEHDRLLIESRLAQRVVLGPLPEPDVRRLAAARLGGEVPEQIAGFLWRNGEGHPGLTLDLLRGLVDRGALTDSDLGLLVNEDRLADMPSAGDYVRARLARLESTTPARRALVASLAVCGPALPVDELHRLVPGVGDNDVKWAIAEGMAVRDPLGRLLLHPPSFGPHVEAALDEAARTALHRAGLALPGRTPRQRFAHLRATGDTARALAEAAAAFAQRPDVELAIVAASMADAADPAASGTWHARAAELLRSRGRYAAAIPHLRSALAATASGQSPVARDELWLTLSTATLRTGDPRGTVAVVAEAQQAGPAPALHARLLGNRAAAHAMLGDDAAAAEDAAEALARAMAVDDPLAEGMAADIEVNLARARGRLDVALQWAQRAAAAYGRAGSALGVIRSMGHRASITRELGDLDGAEQLSRAAVEVARGGENRLPLTEQLLRLAAVLVESGRWSEARTACAEALRLAMEDGRSIEVSVAMTHLGQIEGLLGRPAAARRHSRAAVRLTARHQPSLSSYAWRSLAQAERIGGRLGLAAVAARRARERLREDSIVESRWCSIEYGRALAQRELWTEAGAVWDAALDQVSVSSSPETALLMVLAGRAALRRNAIDEAETRRAGAEEWVSRHRLPWISSHLRLLDAELEFARGLLREGLEHAKAALAGFAALSAPAERAAAILAIAHRAPALPDAREMVVAWLDDAVRIFERIGDRNGRERALTISVEWLRRSATASTVIRDQGLIERVCWLLNSLTDLDELMRRAMRSAVEQLDAERGVLLLADPETGQLVPTAEYGPIEPSTRAEALGYSRRVVQHVTRGGDSLLVVDADSDPRAASESVADMRLRSILCVPLFMNERPMGAVYLDDSRRTHAFAEADRGMIEGFAHLIAVAIEKSRHHDEIRQENERLGGENLSLRTEAVTRVRAQGVIGSSSPMQRVLGMVEHAARTDTTVLVTGENGTGKEADRAHAAPQRAARDGPVRRGQLRGAAGHAHRERVVRHPRQRGHRRSRPTGQVHGGERRDVVPGRGRRHAADAAGGAAVGDREQGGHTARRQQAAAARRPHHRGDEPRPAAPGRAGPVPRGSVLPAERDRGGGAGAPRAQGRHPGTRAAVPRPVRPPAGTPGAAVVTGFLRGADAQRLAGQRARTAELHRAAAGDDPRPLPAPRSPAA